MTRWLVTGAGGQLGSDLLRVLDGQPVTGLTRGDLDLTDLRAVVAVVDAFAAAGPTGDRRAVVVNAAAWTGVDDAESDEVGAYAVNAAAPARLALACERSGLTLVHVSTDYVFPGDAGRPYEVDDPPGPRSAYGRTKLAGEQAVAASGADALVVRTAWVYGETGANFVKTMARLEGERETLDVVDDQRGSPTWSRDLAGGLVALATSSAPSGVYHCTGRGETTWCGLARAVFEELGADPDRVRPTTTTAFPRPAPRPAYSVLSDSRWLAAGMPALPHWRDALHRAFIEVGPPLGRPERRPEPDIGSQTA